MTHGIDTDFLVAAEIQDHPFHREADALLQSLLADGHDLALVPQTLAEVVRVLPDGQAVSDFFVWLTRHQLGRKRLLDTMLAATFHSAGVRRIVTNNAGDFQVLGIFEIVSFRP
jgi:predicted nucleic acid-binding protein